MSRLLDMLLGQWQEEAISEQHSANLFAVLITKFEVPEPM